MSQAHSSYQRLTRTRVMISGYASLWAAKDHLMQVSSSGYSETYRRFYYKDIQGFLVAETSLSSTLHIMLGVFYLPIAGLVFWLSHSLWATLVCTLLFAGLALWNHLLGPSCSVQVVTQIQQTRLKAFGRRRPAERLLLTLKERIDQAQAELRSSATVAASSPEAATDSGSGAGTAEGPLTGSPGSHG